MIETKFYFKDEFGQVTETNKTYTEDVLEASPAIYLMFADFKNHLKSCGYTDELIKEFADIHFSL
jgi:hypothetical protein